jgi:hypothetical protein
MISFALFIDSDNYRWCGTEREAAYEEVRAWLLVPARAEEGILAQLLRETRGLRPPDPQTPAEGKRGEKQYRSLL